MYIRKDAFILLKPVTILYFLPQGSGSVRFECLRAMYKSFYVWRALPRAFFQMSRTRDKFTDVLEDNDL